jgi:hypothetical protein
VKLTRRFRVIMCKNAHAILLAILPAIELANFFSYSSSLLSYEVHIYIFREKGTCHGRGSAAHAHFMFVSQELLVINKSITSQEQSQKSRR